MSRTHLAGTLRAQGAGQGVTLAGWVARRRDHRGVAFVDVRDASGLVQAVVRDEAAAALLGDDTYVRVSGTAALRPAGNANPELPTGDVEVVVTDVDVLGATAADDREDPS